MATVLIHATDGGDHLVAGLFASPVYTASEISAFWLAYVDRREEAFERSESEGDQFPGFADWCTQLGHSVTEVEYEGVDFFSGEVQ